MPLEEPPIDPALPKQFDEDHRERLPSSLSLQKRKDKTFSSHKLERRERADRLSHSDVDESEEIRCDRYPRVAAALCAEVSRNETGRTGLHVQPLESVSADSTPSSEAFECVRPTC